MRKSSSSAKPEDGESVTPPATPRGRMFSRVTGVSAASSDQHDTLRVVPRLEAVAAAAAKKAAMAKDGEAREQAAIATKKAELKKLMERNARTAQRMSNLHIHSKVAAEAAIVASVAPTQKLIREPVATAIPLRSSVSRGFGDAAGHGSSISTNIPNRRTSPSPESARPVRGSRTPPRQGSCTPVGKTGNCTPRSTTPRSTTDLEMIQVEAQLRELEALRKKNEENTKRMLARARASGPDKASSRSEVPTEHSTTLSVRSEREIGLENHRLEMEMLRAKNARNVERMKAQRKLGAMGENDTSPVRRGASSGYGKQGGRTQARTALAEVQPPEIAAD